MIPFSDNGGNHPRVLCGIQQNSPISRAELSRLLSLTRPTISLIVQDLLDKGYAMEVGKGESIGGKKPINLSLNSSAGFAIGVDLADESYLRGVLCDFSGEIVRELEIEYENTFPKLFSGVSGLIKDLASACDGTVKGVGIAVSGIVDSKSNEVVSSSNFDIAGKNLASRLENDCGFPVFLENRPNAAAFAESVYGVGGDFQNLIYLSSGRGSGAGIILNGEIFSGSFGAAGEIRQIIVQGDGGRNAIFEEEIRLSSLMGDLSKVKSGEIDFPELSRLYQDGDEVVVKLVTRHADCLAYGAAVITNIINPEAIVLGGRVIDLGEKYFDAFKMCFQNLITANCVDKIKILRSRFGREGTAFGGAALVLDQMLKLKI